MARLIGISGKRGAGKTLLGGILVYHGVKMFNLADALKEETKRLFNIGEEHVNGNLKEVPVDRLGDHTPRELMIDFGSLGRKYSKDGKFWINRLYNMKIAQLPDDQLVSIPDVRFKNEAEFIKSHKGILIRLERDPKLNVYKGELNDPSETDLDDWKFDMVLSKEKNINAESLKQFAYKIKEFAVEKFADSKSINP